MRAIVFVHRDTGQRHICACIQQIALFMDRADRDDWICCQHRKRWRQ
ncbi:hypothetical protein ACFOM8_02210 [Paracoccus angustae]|uniref:Uncharacterized protein n=1 Tax=Paracoccus angustae TaxID=1671480 RepID=A0ABV7TZP1_9RHOB